MGESSKEALRVGFDNSLKLEFHGSKGMVCSQGVEKRSQASIEWGKPADNLSSGQENTCCTLLTLVCYAK